MRTEGGRVVSCRFKKYRLKARTVRKPGKKHKAKNVKAAKEIRESVQYTVNSYNAMQKTGEALVRNIEKDNLDEPYSDVVVIPEIGIISLFKNNAYQILMSVGHYSSQMRRAVPVFQTGAGFNLIRANVSNPTWLKSIHQCDMRDICSASDTRVKGIRSNRYSPLYVWITHLRQLLSRKQDGCVSSTYNGVYRPNYQIDKPD